MPLSWLNIASQKKNSKEPGALAGHVRCILAGIAGILQHQ